MVRISPVWLVLVEPQKGYHPPAATAAATGTVPKDGTIMMPTGHVSVEQLTAVLSTLPLDLTFVDADDRVAFFSEGPDRIFARSKAIIGRKVTSRAFAEKGDPII